MRTHLIVTCLAALLAAAPASALDKVRITGTKKTVDKRQSSVQQVPHGSTSLTEKQVVYVFSLQRMAPDVPETITASWVLIEESMDGRYAEADRNTSVVVLPLGRSVTVESAPVTLNEREWVKRGGGGSVSSSLAGYGLRLLDDKGGIVAERIEPAALAKEINWDKRPENPTGKRAEIQKLQQEIKAEQQARRDKRLRP